MRHSYITPLFFILICWNVALTFSNYSIYQSSQLKDVIIAGLANEVNAMSEKIKVADKWLLDEWRDGNLKSEIYVMPDNRLLAKTTSNGITN